MTGYTGTDDFSRQIEKMLRNLALIAAGLWIAVAGIASASTANAVSLESPRDCDANAVIRCGALSTEELQRKYNNQADVRALFRHFRISSEDMSQIGNTAVEGRVTKSGRVVVDGKTVATDAMTAGRQRMQGSNGVDAGGSRFYTRAPSVSFESNSLKAFVVMKNGQFDYAVIASCGNPVTAIPKHQPAAPKQPEQPAAPVPEAPAPAVSATAVATANVNITEVHEEKEVVREKEVVTPAPAPVDVTPVETQPVTLPKTGLDDALALVALTAAGGTTAHLLYSRSKYRKFL